MRMGGLAEPSKNVLEVSLTRVKNKIFLHHELSNFVIFVS